MSRPPFCRESVELDDAVECELGEGHKRPHFAQTIARVDHWTDGRKMMVTVETITTYEWRGSSTSASHKEGT